MSASPQFPYPGPINILTYTRIPAPSPSPSVSYTRIPSPIPNPHPLSTPASPAPSPIPIRYQCPHPHPSQSPSLYTQTRSTTNQPSAVCNASGCLDRGPPGPLNAPCPDFPSHLPHMQHDTKTGRRPNVVGGDRVLFGVVGTLNPPTTEGHRCFLLGKILALKTPPAYWPIKRKDWWPGEGGISFGFRNILISLTR